MALDDVQFGDLVNVPGGMYGTVRYLGTVAGKPGKFAGIELGAEHAKRGKNSGDVEGRKYFSTATPGAGIFVPMNNSKYVTKRTSATPAASAPATTPARASTVNFSKSVGPSPSMPRPRVSSRRPSLPRPESPRAAPTPSKMSLPGPGLRTPSAVRTGPGSGGFPQTPVKTPSRLSGRPSSRVSEAEENRPPTRGSDAQRYSSSTETQDLRDQVKGLEKQLLERDKQLGEQATMLSEFQKTLEELEGSDGGVSVRAQIREKNEKIAQLTAEFDNHRADFRSTLDTLEVAASETERVYEQRLDEIMQENKELQDRGEDVEVVARQLKQLEELVSELEEGLEDARRGEAEARAEVEFLRGEVERTKLELKKERDDSAAALKDAQTLPEGPPQSKELDQKDDEIRGLKAIIHSLSRGDPNFPGLQNGVSTGLLGQDKSSERVSRLEQRIQEFEDMNDKKSTRIEELERELQQVQVNGHRSSATMSPRHHRKSSSSGRNMNNANHAHRLSDRTVVPSDWQESPHDRQHPPLHSRGLSDATQQHLETMHESDARSSDDGGALWCEVCETNGHDILHCTNMFGVEMKKNASSNGHSNGAGVAADKPTPEQPAEDTTSHQSTGLGIHGGRSPQKTGRDVVHEGLKGIGGMPSSTSMTPVAGKESGVIDESKWCALCERDGHESIDCPFDE